MPNEEDTPAHMLPFAGFMWWDMPGYDKEDKKITFALLRYGKYKPEMDGELPTLSEKRKFFAERQKELHDLAVEDKRKLRYQTPDHILERAQRFRRQLSLKTRYDKLEKTRGWVNKFFQISGLARGGKFYPFLNGEPVGCPTLDSIEYAIKILEKEQNERNKTSQ